MASLGVEQAAGIVDRSRKGCVRIGVAELRLDGLRFRAPVFHGDTLTAYTEVLETRDADQDDAGVVRFKHWGLKQDETVVFEGEREVLIKRRTHWAER